MAGALRPLGSLVERSSNRRVLLRWFPKEQSTASLISTSSACDLSIYCRGKHLNLDFMWALDPALKPVTDPLQPATLVIHALRHADPLFAPREGGLAGADPVE